MSGISVESIFEIFTERLNNEGIWFMLALRDAQKPLLKEQLKEEVNRIYIEKNTRLDKQQKPLISSRYILDRYTERLEGAGLVNVDDIGKARLYSLSELGHEFLNYTRRKRETNNN